MKRTFQILAFLILLIPSLTFGATYYVCDDGDDCNAGKGSGWSTGSDRNNGTSKATPWKTIEYALSKYSGAGAGDTIIVGDGTYTDHDGDDSVAHVRTGGSKASWLTIKAENFREATLDGGASHSTSFGFEADASTSNYIRFEGFELIRFKWSAFQSNRSDGNGSYWYISGCWMHDMNRDQLPAECQSTMNGVSGMYTGESTHDITIDSCLINDIGRNKKTEEWWTENCAIAYSHNQSHDHGLYLEGYHITVKNCIMYNFRAGSHIKISEHDVTLDDSDWTHRIINNTFYKQTCEKSIRVGKCFIFYNMNDWSKNFAQNVRIENNIGEDGDDYFVWFRHLGANEEIYLRNNVFDSKTLYYLETEYKGSEQRQIIDNLANNHTGRSDINMTDPANRDFSLANDSYCIDKGVATYAPNYDYAGNSRPYGKAVDSGAYEYTIGSPTRLKIILN